MRFNRKKTKAATRFKKKKKNYKKSNKPKQGDKESEDVAAAG